MSLAVDFTEIPRLSSRDYRLPDGGFLPTTPVPAKAEPDHLVAGDFAPSYRVLDGLAAVGESFLNPLAGLFSPGLV
jgi:hypothetical protein